MGRRVLFVCTGNMDRSPTAESLLSRKDGFEVDSAGTWMHAQRSISRSLIEWADLIFVMESHHKDVVLSICPDAGDKVIVLDIPDVYVRNDPELIATLKRKLEKHLKIEW